MKFQWNTSPFKLNQHPPTPVDLVSLHLPVTLPMLHIFQTENVAERSWQKDPAIWLHLMTNEWKSVAVKITQKHMFKIIITEFKTIITVKDYYHWIYLVLPTLDATFRGWSAMSFKVIISQFSWGWGLSIKPINLYWHKNK